MSVILLPQANLQAALAESLERKGEPYSTADVDRPSPGQTPVGTADLDWSVRMAKSVMRRHVPLTDRWRYEYGVILKSIERVWLKTGHDEYGDYIVENVNRFVEPDGNIDTYRPHEYNLDQINPGKILFPLYDRTSDDRYRKAAYRLMKQLRDQPRTTAGGFWHKKIYPHQMWLDGIYMASPFYAQFAQTFGEPEGFDDVALQITLVERHARDSRTGLLYHGWDESCTQKWANPETGCSPSFWGRAMGWYAMGIVDVLDWLPIDHPMRGEIVGTLQRVAAALADVQHASTGLWYQVLDQGGREGNYHEASASCMFVYALTKGVRKGHLDRVLLDVARTGYKGILEHFVKVDDQGLVNLHQICSVAGLGGTPYRDGSFEYYVSERVVTNDYKGVGPFIMASVEMETLR
jgi:unsaturated rhamnogalacturonyl hydrolase